MSLFQQLKKIFNKFIPKDPQSIFFFPHYNCISDGYDILNGDSDNVLCLFNSIIRDERFKNFQLYIVYFHPERIESYKKYCTQFNLNRIHFIRHGDNIQFYKSFTKCHTIFTDCDYIRVPYKTTSQRCICLNYFGGLIKSEFHRWANHGGFPRMIQEQRELHNIYDYYISLSDISSKFIALDTCHYYSNFKALGFPRMDILFKSHHPLRYQIENYAGFKIKHLITYVPTHRDYENPNREFYNKNKGSMTRSIWGYITEEELNALEKTLHDSETLIVAKVHPIQKAQTSTIKEEKRSHIVYYNDLVDVIKTSLNPLFAISDCIITDYTTAVYDFLILDRPIIYYFYDIEEYRKTRSFFIEPIESICAGHLTYSITDLCNAIQDIANGIDPEKEKRLFLKQLFIKHADGNSTERIINFFFPNL